MSDLLKETIKAGEPLEINFPFYENGYEFPITDYSVSIMLKSDRFDGKKIQHWVDGDPAITRTTSMVTLTLDAEFTNALNFKVAYMDCWITKSSIGDGIKSDPVEFTLDRGVTR